MEADLGRQLTEEENKFIASQLEQRAIQLTPSNQRSDDQKSTLRKLQKYRPRIAAVGRIDSSVYIGPGT